MRKVYALVILLASILLASCSPRCTPPQVISVYDSTYTITWREPNDQESFVIDGKPLTFDTKIGAFSELDEGNVHIGVPWATRTSLVMQFEVLGDDDTSILGPTIFMCSTTISLIADDLVGIEIDGLFIPEDSDTLEA